MHYMKLLQKPDDHMYTRVYSLKLLNNYKEVVF